MSDNDTTADDSSTDYPAGYPDVEQHKEDFYEVAIPLGGHEGGRREVAHRGGVITVWLTRDQLRSWRDRIADELRAVDLVDEALASAGDDVRKALADIDSKTPHITPDSATDLPDVSQTTPDAPDSVELYERFEQTGHSPPNLSDESTVVGATAEFVPIGSHHCHPVTVETGEAARQMYECVDCGVTSNSITRFRQDTCDGSEGF